MLKDRHSRVPQDFRSCTAPCRCARALPAPLRAAGKQRGAARPVPRVPLPLPLPCPPCLSFVTPPTPASRPCYRPHAPFPGGMPPVRKCLDAHVWVGGGLGVRGTSLWTLSKQLQRVTWKAPNGLYGTVDVIRLLLGDPGGGGGGGWGVCGPGQPRPTPPPPQRTFETCSSGEK